MTDNLAAALARVQGQLLGVRKEMRNPHLKTMYADLASCWEACRELLASNGLAVTQTVYCGDNGHLALKTTLHHVSGEVFSDGGIPIVYGESKGLNLMQSMGSAITYARRYGLCAMVGLCPEDNDGATAGPRSPREEERAAPVVRKAVDENQRVVMKENLLDSLRESPNLNALKVRYANAYRTAKKAGDEKLCEELHSLFKDMEEGFEVLENTTGEAVDE